ncbi:MAG TPA: cytochrome c oxidase subunit 3 [Candidatus Binataceae bacterium]|nr:cytochrome c oxidase subunit 3 [Candidatus Binataceae bacterium]
MSKSKLAVVLFILSEVVFFALLIVAYVYFHAYPGEGPTAANSLNAARTGVFSIFLFASSGTMALASRSYRVKSGAMLGWLIVTVVLGGIFLFGQAHEYMGLYASGVTANRSLFATTFFTLTGFHGLHVAVGLLAITVVAVLTASGSFGATERETEAFGSVEIYWHFVDAVWVVIFSIVYLWAFL